MKILQCSICVLSVWAVMASGAINTAQAAYPEKTVRFLVGFPPGGSTDLLARKLGEKLAAKWGQPVITENRPGADGTIAGSIVAHSPPDGYTIVMATGNHTITPSMINLNYDPVQSFSPVVMLASSPHLFTINAKVPANSLKEFIALAKANPGKFNYGSSGLGSSPALEMAMFMQMTGIKMQHVPYEGGSQALNAMLGNEIQLMFSTVTASGIELVKSGKLKSLAVSTNTRFPAMPDIPTVAEAADLPDFNGSNWYGVLAPAGTPPDIVNKLHDDLLEAANMPDVQKFIVDQGFVGAGSTPKEFTQFLTTDVARWENVLKQIGYEKK